jgi:hypothetical protein
MKKNLFILIALVFAALLIKYSFLLFFEFTCVKFKYLHSIFYQNLYIVSNAQINTSDDTYSQALPEGAYFLVVKKSDDRKFFKLIGRNAR